MSRWDAYVTRRLDELERGEGDFTDLKRPSAAAVTHARQVAAQVFRDTTPTPSVVPDEDGNVLFVWHKSGIDAEIWVWEEDSAGVWVHDRGTGEMWSGSLADHQGCCVRRLLDALEKTAVGGRLVPVRDKVV
jgi:hypothetical protein